LFVIVDLMNKVLEYFRFSLKVVQKPFWNSYSMVIILQQWFFHNIDQIDESYRHSKKPNLDYDKKKGPQRWYILKHFFLFH